MHPFVGNVADAATIGPAAEGCEVVLHLTAIVDESGQNTFERINVEGTRNVVRAAEQGTLLFVVRESAVGWYEVVVPSGFRAHVHARYLEPAADGRSRGPRRPRHRWRRPRSSRS